MAFQTIQRCVSTEPYFTQWVPSESQEGLSYEVHSVWPDDAMSDYTCSCPAFLFNGKCKHQEKAFQDRCLWSEEHPEVEKQTPEQRENMICPRCGQQTLNEWRMNDD